MSDEVDVPVIKQRKKRNLDSMRKRDADAAATGDAEGGADVDGDGEVADGGIVKKSHDKTRGLLQATKPALKKDEEKTTLIQDLAFTSTRSAMPSGDSRATAANIIDGEMAERMVAEQNKLAARKAAEEAGALGDGIYRGQAAYTQWREDPDKDVSKTARRGPVASSAYARQTAIFDYAQAICKDYKETGVCGYGDNCIYMHDRSDYKTGWELERDWEAQQKAKEAGGGEPKDDDKGEYFVGSDSEDDDGLPFACFICRQPFTKPVVTKCNHYFCEKCARDRFVKKKKSDCAQCGAVTDGVFNVAKAIIKKVERMSAK